MVGSTAAPMRPPRRQPWKELASSSQPISDIPSPPMTLWPQRQSSHFWSQKSSSQPDAVLESTPHIRSMEGSEGQLERHEAVEAVVAVGAEGGVAVGAGEEVGHGVVGGAGLGHVPSEVVSSLWRKREEKERRGYTG